MTSCFQLSVNLELDGVVILFHSNDFVEFRSALFGGLTFRAFSVSYFLSLSPPHDILVRRNLLTAKVNM
jgi:hypothetical protein